MIGIACVDNEKTKKWAEEDECRRELNSVNYMQKSKIDTMGVHYHWLGTSDHSAEWPDLRTCSTQQVESVIETLQKGIAPPFWVSCVLFTVITPPSGPHPLLQLHTNLYK